MPNSTVTVEDYLARLQRLAAGADHIERFYLFLDEDLYDMESELADSPRGQEFYDALVEQFRAWRAEIGEEKWQEVLTYNDSLNGANRNWLLDEI